MPQIHIITEKAFRSRSYIDERCRTWIHPDQVKAILDRETGEGPLEEYIVCNICNEQEKLNKRNAKIAKAKQILKG